MHGNKAVFLARFIMGARFMAGPMAGAAGMRFWSFLGWNVLGAFIWCSVMITIGYFVGDQLDWVAHVALKGGQWVAAAVLLLAAAIWLFWRNLHHRRDFKASTTCRSKEKET
jgi:membrane protein DedA with SNARE-associated domain